MFSSFSKEYNEIWNNNKKTKSYNINTKINKNNIIYSNELVKDLKILKRCNSLESIDYNINRINNEINIRLGLDNRYSIESSVYSLEGVGNIWKKIKDGVLFAIGKIISFFQFLGKKIAEFFGKIFKKKTEQVKQEVEEADKMAQEIKRLPAASTSTNQNNSTPPPQEVKSEPEPEPVAQPDNTNTNSNDDDREPITYHQQPKPTFNQQTVKIKKPQYGIDDVIPPVQNLMGMKTIAPLLEKDPWKRIADFFKSSPDKISEIMRNTPNIIGKLSQIDPNSEEFKKLVSQIENTLKDFSSNGNGEFGEMNRKNWDESKSRAIIIKQLLNSGDGKSFEKGAAYQILKIEKYASPKTSYLYEIFEREYEIKAMIESDERFIKEVSSNLSKLYGILRSMNIDDHDDQMSKINALPNDVKAAQITNQQDRVKRMGNILTQIMHFYQNISKYVKEATEIKRKLINDIVEVFSIYSKQLKFENDIRVAKTYGKKYEIV